METLLLQKIADSVIDGQPELTLENVEKALTAGILPLTIIENGLVSGMAVVGQKYDEGEFFLPNLIISANAMRQAMTRLEQALRDHNQQVTNKGTVVIGTVQGDIHEIGKTLVGILLSVNGFEVHDLGVDVSIQRFLDTIQETNANLLGLSSLLTTTMTIQRDIITALKQSGLRDKVKVMVGGAPVSQAWSDQIGADGYAEDALSAVELAKRLVVNYS